MSVVVDHWAFDPFLIVAVLILAWYEVGLRRLISRSRADRVPALRRRSVWFYAGVAVLLLAVISPIDYWSDEYFYMHMVQHLLLLFAAPSLIVAGAPWQPLLLGVPLRWRRRFLRVLLHDDWARPLRVVGGALLRPVVAVAAFNIVMIAWQLPVLFDFAERNRLAHIWLMHGSMFAVGVLFWLQIIPSPPVRSRITLAGQAIALMSTSVIMWILAMSMSMLTQSSWYTAYDHVAGVALAPFADQQIGAGILWVCGDFWAIPALIVVVRRLIAQEGDVDSAIHSILGEHNSGRPRWPSASRWP